MSAPKTIFEKIWETHEVVKRDDGQSLLYVDRHILHDGSFHAFGMLRDASRTVRQPYQTFGTPDHYASTVERTLDEMTDLEAREKVEMLASNADEFGIHHFGLEDSRMGIVHVIGPELGITQPGILLCCGDSHTSTHGAMGCISFGIGASEASHVLATQSIWQRKPKSMRVTVTGQLGFGVTGKDVALALIAQESASCGVGYAIEYAGPCINQLDIEGRLTLSNMTIEAGSRIGIIAPDEKTIKFLEGSEFGPKGRKWDLAVEAWKGLPTDEGAEFDREVTLNGSTIAPMVTWGTSPQHAIRITEPIPDPEAEPDSEKREAMKRALTYTGLVPGQLMTDVSVDRVFIGSCTNSRIQDLRLAAEVVKGQRVKVWSMISPGSGKIRQQAEAEGLDRIFTDAGFDWRHSGCSMCVGLNGDLLNKGERSASTSNRNFEGRQGPETRTHLVSPAMAAAAAVTGKFTDVRTLMERR